ncbi:lipopolysaccharide biosynthesis protein [Labrys neptuniae]
MRGEIGSLSKRTAKASAWVAGARIAAKGVDLVALIVLARFLGPSDFGLVAMAMTLIFIVEAVMELPLSSAMLRVSNPGPDVYNTAFTLGLLRGLVIAGFFMICAWPLSYFYGEARLVPLVMSLALAPAMRGCVNPKMVEFNRQMDFRRQAGLDVLSKVVAMTAAIVMAVLTRSYWSIALGTILVPTVTLIGSFILVPMRPRFTLREWPIFADIVTWNLLSQVLTAINWQVDRLLLPRFINPAAFGRYAMANDLSALPFQMLSAPLATPLNVAFVTAHQNGGLGQTYVKACAGIFMIMAPILCFGGIMAGPLLHIFLGTQWLEAAPILTALALTSIFSVLSFPMAPLAFSLNQSRQITIRSLVEFVIRVPSAIVGILIFGVAGAVCARGLTSAAVLVSTMLAVRTLIGVPVRTQLRSLAGPVLALVIAGLPLAYVASVIQLDAGLVPSLLQVAAAGLAYVSLYVVGVYVTALWLGDVTGITTLLTSMLAGTGLRRRA